MKRWKQGYKSRDLLRGTEYRKQVPKEFILFSQDMQNHWSTNNLESGLYMGFWICRSRKVYVSGGVSGQFNLSQEFHRSKCKWKWRFIKRNELKSWDDQVQAWGYNRVSWVCAQPWLKIWDPMNCSVPGSSVHVICQARIQAYCHFFLE